MGGHDKKHNETATDQEIIDYIHGRTNDKTIRHFIGEVDDEELQQLSDEKEQEYHRLARKEKIDYVAGTEALLDELVEKYSLHNRNSQSKNKY